MRVWHIATTAIALLVAGVPARAQDGYAGHQAWADYHISGLAPAIKVNVLRYRKLCGTPFAATHAFAVPSYPGAQSVTLHYENLWCASRAGGICKGETCLHEVYIRDGAGYRLKFRAYISHAWDGTLPDGR